MRDLIDIIQLTEAGLKATGLKPNYINNLISMIRQKQPVTLTPKAQEALGKESVVIDPRMADVLQSMVDATRGKTISGGYLDFKDTFPAFPTKDGSKISLSNIEKSPAIKGKELDYNVGDIGEIALGVAAGARFLKSAEEINAIDFVNLANKLKASRVTNTSGKTLSSLELSYLGKLTHATGKQDNVEITILGPGRSIKEFITFMKYPGDVPDDVKGTILSAIQYANGSKKIEVGVQQTASNPEINTIEITCDGVSDQKGTKADLVMTIDGQRINLLSAKTGPSQLGQASGHQWARQQAFFQTVFGVDISPYAKLWGTTNEQHLAALQKVWTQLVIPRVTQLTGGDSVQKEKALVRSISNGLIRYSNNVDPTGQVETIDVVKLITDPGSPGYNLLRIDSRLTDALEKTDLVGEPTKNGSGIQVSGNVNGKKLLLFKARSYFSPAGKVVRTIIEGGPLLDQLATVTPEQPVQQPVKPQPAEAPVQEERHDNINLYGRKFQR
jgi:hypothetical protein